MCIIGSLQCFYCLIIVIVGFEIYLMLLLDGFQVVYEVDMGVCEGSIIKVQIVGNMLVCVLVEILMGQFDCFLNWLLDGCDIVFVCFGVEGSCEVFIVSVIGGVLCYVICCDGIELLSFDWMLDGCGLIFGVFFGVYVYCGIWVLDIVSGCWILLVYDIGEDDFDYVLCYLLDGCWIVFVCNLQVGDLWWMLVSGGMFEQFIDDLVEICGWSWCGDSCYIVFG